MPRLVAMALYSDVVMGMIGCRDIFPIDILPNKASLYDAFLFKAIYPLCLTSVMCQSGKCHGANQCWTLRESFI